MINQFLQPLFIIALTVSCSYLPFFTDEEKLKKETQVFIIFDPYIKTNIKKVAHKKRWCFEIRQVFRATEYWRLCFDDQIAANACFQKVYRLQKNNRKKSKKRELYRPGEIVQLSYLRKRKNYLNKVIDPSNCFAFKTPNEHLIRSIGTNSEWRKYE